MARVPFTTCQIVRSHVEKRAGYTKGRDVWKLKYQKTESPIHMEEHVNSFTLVNFAHGRTWLGLNPVQCFLPVTLYCTWRNMGSDHLQATTQPWVCAMLRYLICTVFLQILLGCEILLDLSSPRGSQYQALFLRYELGKSSCKKECFLSGTARITSPPSPQFATCTTCFGRQKRRFNAYYRTK